MDRGSVGWLRTTASRAERLGAISGCCRRSPSGCPPACGARSPGAASDCRRVIMVTGEPSMTLPASWLSPRGLFRDDDLQARRHFNVVRKPAYLAIRPLRPFPAGIGADEPRAGTDIAQPRPRPCGIQHRFRSSWAPFVERRHSAQGIGHRYRVDRRQYGLR